MQETVKLAAQLAAELAAKLLTELPFPWLGYEMVSNELAQKSAPLPQSQTWSI